MTNLSGTPGKTARPAAQPRRTDGPAGIYIHVPFCASKCGYCDFYSRVRQDQKAGYLAALGEEIRGYKGQGIPVDTIFFGGGTPSVLSPDEIGGILAALRESFTLLPEGEWTMEANPETVSPGYLQAVRALGINRLSYGIQSGVDRELRALGRKHTFARAAEAVKEAREAGIKNLSLDLMLGIPYQTADSLRETLDKILALHPNHLSCYLLKIEPGTPFARRHAETDCPSDDEAADFYLTVCETLRAAGFTHYEISNFARPGYESRHNLKYWRDTPYIGFGPAAHSCFGGKRFYNPADLALYIEKGGRVSAVEDDGSCGGYTERLMLGLRLAGGVSLPEIAALDLAFTPEEQAAFASRCAPYIRAGLMERKDGRIAITEKGMLVSNGLLAEIL